MKWNSMKRPSPKNPNLNFIFVEKHFSTFFSLSWVVFHNFFFDSEYMLDVSNGPILAEKSV
jgi:hypothetical protein